MKYNCIFSANTDWRIYGILYFEALSKRKKKCTEVEQGFNRFEPKVKNVIIGSFIVMFASCVEILITLFLFPKQLWYLMGIFLSIVALSILFFVDNKDQKAHMDKYVLSHKKKIDILENVL